MDELVYTEGLNPDDPSNLDPVLLVKTLYEDSLQNVGEYFEASKRELEFCLKQAHYEYERNDPHDWTTIQPTTPDLYHTVRHKTEEISGSQIYIECRSVDDAAADPMAPEVARGVIESIVLDPLKRYM